MDISKIDKNFDTGAVVSENGLVFRNIMSEEFRIYGVFREDDGFARMPAQVAAVTSPEVTVLSRNTAGGRVRFITNSKRIALRVKFSNLTRMAHMAFTGIHGFDIYDGTTFIKSFVPPIDGVDKGYELLREFDVAKSRIITINFPLYNSVDEVYIGLDEGATLDAAPDYKIEKPIVYYGSSITQGGCASRPGMSYQAIISRSLDANYINLGFSGSGRGEKSVAEYIASLDMSAFVMDYDYNAQDEEHLKATHKPFFETIRKSHPDIPIIVITAPRYYKNDVAKRRSEIIRQTYLDAKAAGDDNVYFIEGGDLMGDEIRNEGTVDDCHPTDLGFYFMAKGILPYLKKALLGE